MRSQIIRRPRQTNCPSCGGAMWLVDCGVNEHHKTRTRREQLDGRCPGRVYVHSVTGGIECES